ncbi:MAG: hypothetical protein EOM54_12160 [Clostridia bacterium]|nr:hypothetical protein [Clostridia bacterium]
MKDILYCCTMIDRSEAPDASPELLSALGFEFSSWKDEETKEVRHTLYFQEEKESLSAQALLKEKAADFASFGCVFEQIECPLLKREDWAESWKLHFKPMVVSERLAVSPSWEKFQTLPGQALIILDPGMSFGTGQHATTKFCLASIDRFIAELKRKRHSEISLLDAGSGSGILAIGGKLLGCTRVDAFDIDPEKSKGRDILTVSRSLQMQKLLHDAIGGRRSESSVTLGGGQYQIIASPVESRGSVTGAVLLTLDVTEKSAAEKLRREFTANVSHELKTPLQSISGYAEIIQNGLVKPEDMHRFIGQIYSEAQRLITLVEDIIRLSRLDEGGELPREETDLFKLANETVSYLAPSAKEMSVTLEAHGEKAVISGVPQLLGEIIYNLCDNAIKYNRPGGRVDVTVENRSSEAVLAVRDTGIGIPKEHQSRIFERFYRVDKSHSKETGGTGLGLSIAKHAALIHGARIEVDSTPGIGTTMTVRFPKAK